MYMYVTVKA